MFGGKRFDPDKEIPDLTAKTILVTGGNNGLGLETCRQLAKHNAHIYLAARTPSKAESAIADIKGTAPNANITFLELDLASLESVKKAADTFSAESDRLDVLINNAGVMALPASTTKEGYEIQFGTNHIGHFLFTKLLMPTLQRTAESRIVNLSSEGHRLPPKGGLALKDAQSNMASYNTWVRYGQSKLANILFTRELSRRYPAIKSVSLHPGGIDTGLSLGFQKAHPWLAVFLRPIASPFLTTVQKGALTQLFAATSEEAKTGTYYVPTATENAGSKYSQDSKLAGELWDWTEQTLAEHGY
ncbi:MAG: hypothetical protein ALECFALPRED_003104 [Alectoria fallacina]|uniref:NAD(P)-binding protein n=1 Tax=Alectoria fallacina TaxID=1903189 RepID=A0A8H3IS17_9LECA|nr:MAG: hypothetical protein ALECFALPRED_003104 [Alectoria fallacina]